MRWGAAYVFNFNGQNDGKTNVSSKTYWIKHSKTQINGPKQVPFDNDFGKHITFSP